MNLAWHSGCRYQARGLMAIYSEHCNGEACRHKTNSAAAVSTDDGATLGGFCMTQTWRNIICPCLTGRNMALPLTSVTKKICSMAPYQVSCLDVAGVFGGANMAIRE